MATRIDRLTWGCSEYGGIFRGPARNYSIGGFRGGFLAPRARWRPFVTKIVSEALGITRSAAGRLTGATS
jgi:hypothetical protein